MSPATDTVATLRDRLLALRDDLRQRLAAAEALDAGLLRVLADVETVLAALTCEPSPGKPNQVSP
jgi:hypothetical protein